MRGPLIVVQDVADVGWDEVAEIKLESGEVRHGTVLDVHGDLAVVEVLEGTAGMRLDSARVAFSGAPMRIPVGGWVARAGSATAEVSRSTAAHRCSGASCGRSPAPRSTPRGGPLRARRS